MPASFTTFRVPHRDGNRGDLGVQSIAEILPVVLANLLAERTPRSEQTQRTRQSFTGPDMTATPKRPFVTFMSIRA